MTEEEEPDGEGLNPFKPINVSYGVVSLFLFRENGSILYHL